MTQAFALEQAIKTVVSIRVKNTDVTAIWGKLDRVASYLNKQLAAELTNWDAA